MTERTLNAAARARDIDWLSERLTPPEVAKLVGVSIGTLANWRCVRRGPSFYKLKPGRCFYLRRDVDRWLAESRVECFGAAK